MLRPGPARRGTSRHVAARHGTSRHVAARHGTARHAPLRLDVLHAHRSLRKHDATAEIVDAPTCRTDGAGSIPGFGSLFFLPEHVETSNPKWRTTETRGQPNPLHCGFKVDIPTTRYIVATSRVTSTRYIVATELAWLNPLHCGFKMAAHYNRLRGDPLLWVTKMAVCYHRLWG